MKTSRSAVFAGTMMLCFGASATPSLAGDQAQPVVPEATPSSVAPSDSNAMSASERAGATPIAGDETYKAFGGKQNIDPMIVDFVQRISTDPRISVFFAKANLTRLTFELQAQVCYLTGGPCEYTGKDMRSAHAAMGVHDSDFNALAEDLQISMNKYQVPFSAQNKLLAKLAPMERPIVTKKALLPALGGS